MTTVVKAKLDSILKYPFFKSVGQPLPSTVSAVDSWPKAIKNRSSAKWKNNKLQARNALQSGITGQFQKPGMCERMQEWNPLCEELRPIIVSFAESLVSNAPLSNSDRKGVRDGIGWDLLLICLEVNYKDIVKPIFYIPYMDPWYAAGHYPCGWDGDEFSEEWNGDVRGGQLIVF